MIRFISGSAFDQGETSGLHELVHFEKVISFCGMKSIFCSRFACTKDYVRLLNNLKRIFYQNDYFILL